MKYNNQLGETVRNYREGLGMTQRALAQQLGVEPSHIAFIEGGRRKPSLKLTARLADTLGLDRQNFLILVHPEAKEFFVETKPEQTPKTSTSWQRFIKNRALLNRY